MKQYGLIGYPLGHSFSKQYFTEKFEKEAIKNCIFENYPIPTIKEFPSLISHTANLSGLCVTIPYKELVLPYITNISPEVNSIGATNSLKINNGIITAYNTDYRGFTQSFVPQLLPHHQKALILGTGGASKAVQFALSLLKIPFLLVSRKSSSNGSCISYDELNRDIPIQYQIIINCSPAGMQPFEDTCPKIPFQFLSAAHYLYDLVYKPAETLFLKKGREAGAITKNGMDMLLFQAEATWSIWNNPNL